MNCNLAFQPVQKCKVEKNSSGRYLSSSKVIWYECDLTTSRLKSAEMTFREWIFYGEKVIVGGRRRGEKVLFLRTLRWGMCQV